MRFVKILAESRGSDLSGTIVCVKLVSACLRADYEGPFSLQVVFRVLHCSAFTCIIRV